MARSLEPLTSIDREVELLVADTALARAWFEGVPAARLLARIQIQRCGEREDGAETWDLFLRRLLALVVGRDTESRFARAIARNLRAAQDEGPLLAADGVAALLVLAASTSADASLGEIFEATTAMDLGLARACARYEPRIVVIEGAVDARPIRIAAFEACVRLATTRSAGPWPQGRLLSAARALSSSALGPFLVTEASGRLYPHDMDGAHPHARMVLVDRTPLEGLAARHPMEVAQAVSLLERTAGVSGGLDTLIADVARLLEPGGDIILTAPLFDPEIDLPIPSAPPSEPASSTLMPLDWSHPDAVVNIASALQSGSLPFARLRQLVKRGGEPALDAIGAEMLDVSAHPIASDAFAEILAKSGRPRDVIRLVTYFAVTPDPLLAARVLGECDAPELPTVLRAWLEAMLPSDGECAPPGDDPGTSSAARVAACVSSLEPYPQLYGAVRPLLSRVSVAAPASG